jgi:diguanylate cyclase (GGDEF)-like protein/PAS domain S-box-containing protein
MADPAPTDLILLARVLDSLPDYVWICDSNLQETIYLSLACERLLGVPRDKLLGDCRKLMKLVHRADRSKVLQARRDSARTGYDETYRIVRPDGVVRWIQDRSFPIFSESGEPPRVGGIAVDITERKENEQQLATLAYFDGLTRLPNRMLFYDRLIRSFAHARRNKWILALLFIDIDGFKGVNDSFGHAAGDDLLKQLARRLETCARSDDTVGRLNGDEFAVLLSKITAPRDAALVANKLLQIAGTPFLLGSSKTSVTASIGIALYPADAAHHNELVANADIAMYQAKAAGGNNYRYFSSVSV